MGEAVFAALGHRPPLRCTADYSESKHSTLGGGSLRPCQGLIVVLTYWKCTPDFEGNFLGIENSLGSVSAVLRKGEATAFHVVIL